MEREICNPPIYSRYNLQRKRDINCSGKKNSCYSGGKIFVKVNSEVITLIYGSQRRGIASKNEPTIRNSAAQTLLFWPFLNIYISPIAVIIFVMFFNIDTIATFMYFKLKNCRDKKKRRANQYYCKPTIPIKFTSELRQLNLKWKKKVEYCDICLPGLIHLKVTNRSSCNMYTQSEAGSTCTFQLVACRWK